MKKHYCHSYQVAMTAEVDSNGGGGSLQALVECGDKKQILEKLEEVKGKNASSSTLKELFERNQLGHTPLDLAGILGLQEIVQLLLEHGADLNEANKSGT